MTYILVDAANMFFRARHVVRGDTETKVGMAMHIIFNSVKKAWNDFDGNHVVFCLEGRSWRKDFYTPYKANRKVTRDQRSPREMEDDELFFEAYDDMCTFLAEKSNCTVIRQSNAEADDLIATGGSLLATQRLIEQTGAKVVGAVTIINLKYINDPELVNFSNIISALDITK